MKNVIFQWKGIKFSFSESFIFLMVKCDNSQLYITVMQVYIMWRWKKVNFQMDQLNSLSVQDSKRHDISGTVICAWPCLARSDHARPTSSLLFFFSQKVLGIKASKFHKRQIPAYNLTFQIPNGVSQTNL